MAQGVSGDLEALCGIPGDLRRADLAPAAAALRRTDAARCPLEVSASIGDAIGLLCDAAAAELW
jgi:hypothetical protein